MAICPICEKSFEKKTPNHKICSDECRSSEGYLESSKYLTLVKQQAKIGKPFYLQFSRWKELRGSPCFYCGRDKNKTKLSVLRIDPSIPYSSENTISICPECKPIRFFSSIEEYFNHTELVKKHYLLVSKNDPRFWYTNE